MVINQHKNQQGSVLIVVLLFSSLLTLMGLFSWSSALLQNKMAINYQLQVGDLAQAEASLNQVQYDLQKYPHKGWWAQSLPTPDGGCFEDYDIESDKRLMVRLSARIRIYKDANGKIIQVIRKTWEERPA